MRKIALTAIKVKANSNYTCIECGGTELLQAHHQIPGDDTSMICLCAECHSKRHLNLPKLLFFNKSHQPFWYNKSASSLAKKWGVCSRTVIRVARKWEIKGGELTPWDEELIHCNIPTLRFKREQEKRATIRQEKAREREKQRIKIETRHELSKIKLSQYHKKHPNVSIRGLTRIFSSLSHREIMNIIIDHKEKCQNNV